MYLGPPEQKLAAPERSNVIPERWMPQPERSHVIPEEKPRYASDYIFTGVFVRLKHCSCKHCRYPVYFFRYRRIEMIEKKDEYR